MSTVAPEASEEDLARCATGRHNHEHTPKRGVVKCVNCGQVDVAPGCLFYVSPEHPECGKVSVAYVTLTNGQGIKAKVPLCSGHKQHHDVIFAQRRSSRKQH
jgi:hypothetical protein